MFIELAFDPFDRMPDPEEFGIHMGQIIHANGFGDCIEKPQNGKDEETDYIQPDVDVIVSH